MFNQFSFIQAMADQQAANNFAKQREQAMLDAEIIRQQQIAQQIKAELEHAEKIASDKVIFIKNANINAIYALENGDLDAVKLVFESLTEAERESFMHCLPLEQSLMNKQLTIAEYLVDQGLDCDSWEDYIKDKSSTLAVKLLAKNKIIDKLTLSM